MDDHVSDGGGEAGSESEGLRALPVDVKRGSSSSAKSTAKPGPAPRSKPRGKPADEVDDNVVDKDEDPEDSWSAFSMSARRKCARMLTRALELDENELPNIDGGVQEWIEATSAKSNQQDIRACLKDQNIPIKFESKALMITKALRYLLSQK